MAFVCMTIIAACSLIGWGIADNKKDLMCDKLEEMEEQARENRNETYKQYWEGYNKGYDRGYSSGILSRAANKVYSEYIEEK